MIQPCDCPWPVGGQCIGFDAQNLSNAFSLRDYREIFS